jgi:transglutaminase-like putative cysteine protease
MAQREVFVRIAARENLVINGILYRTFRLEGEFWGNRMNFWLDEEGGVLKEEGPLGFTLLRASEARAKGEMEGAPGEDLYRLAAVPVQKKLWRPERMLFLKLRTGGLEDILKEISIQEKGRQSLEGDILLIRREEVPQDALYQVPYREKDMQAFLNPELGVESDHASVVKTVEDIAGGLRNPVSISRKLLDWVYGHVEKIPVMSMPSAIHVLEKKAGDCNEHAVLLAALLRAAGIPARVCAGLVYKDDAFYYHAWNEAYLGSWVSMDAVSNQMPADPTHIKLAQGGPDKQTSILGLIGKIRLEILDHGYD